MRADIVVDDGKITIEGLIISKKRGDGYMVVDLASGEVIAFKMPTVLGENLPEDAKCRPTYVGGQFLVLIESPNFPPGELSFRWL
ncbi:hypothetical protein A2160_05370 [Candidatus Beckwithbacteria bacterium RBG_13_42_9]|uniref:Uncharacterized protein n=1 Tax=Candidatus Beckwithbacteria bacterium RBG_13_42_9 TaxID=1797457 RepID=A0A1F5E6L8_9BACT|nr:MAG: hypothetical protein A2160_05370 [Candidatus Beckwithbacteria bacterium RBG_13_42_9]